MHFHWQKIKRELSHAFPISMGVNVHFNCANIVITTRIILMSNLKGQEHHSVLLNENKSTGCKKKWIGKKWEKGPEKVNLFACLQAKH